MPVWLIILLVWCFIGAIAGFKESGYTLAPIFDSGFFWFMVVLGPIGFFWSIVVNRNAMKKAKRKAVR